jgi:two-component system LytT family response regulator
VTAYDRYALRAFEVHALDYLLKPFDRDRFGKALDRARPQLQREGHAEVRQRLLELLEDTRSSRKPLERLVIKAAGRVFFLRVEEIDGIEAAGNYVRLHCGSDAHLLRETMNGLEARCHRRQAVRADTDTSACQWGAGQRGGILAASGRAET